MEQHALKNVNNCLNTTIYTSLKTPGAHSSNLYLNITHFSTPLLIRHLWQLKTIVFLHWCLICVIPLCQVSFCWVYLWKKFVLLRTVKRRHFAQGIFCKVSFGYVSFCWMSWRLALSCFIHVFERLCSMVRWVILTTVILMSTNSAKGFFY